MKKILQINVLGELQVLRNDRELVLPRSKKTRALLAYLVVTNRRQRRNHLCEMFWNAPDDPRASLRWSLTKLRGLINQDRDQPPLRADSDSVSIDMGEINTDLLHVADITGKNTTGLTTSELETLVSKFRGRFLEGLDLSRCPAFEAWRIFHGDALDRTRSLLLQELVGRLRGEPERAHIYAQALLSLNKTSDPGTLQQSSSRLRTERGEPQPQTGSSVKRLTDDELRPLQEIRYCKGRDGVQIAFAISGQGPPVLRAAHWMSHLQYEWESPVWRHWIDSLSRENTLRRPGLPCSVCRKAVRCPSPTQFGTQTGLRALSSTAATPKGGENGVIATKLLPMKR
jgi:DNA-binding SARP family transcriptional activator